MEDIKLIQETIEVDVLCVGGGIAGLMASIRAAEMGVKAVVAEKGNALGSGRGCSGNDHFWCYIPEVHGTDMDSFMKECLKGPKLKVLQSGTSTQVLRTFLANSFDIVKLWDSWGIPMKYKGKWEFAGHTFPGDVFTHLKYQGQNQKSILVKKALEKGVRIVNRVMILDLLTDGEKVIGAIGINTRENKIIVFKAKSVVVGTGFVDRLYPPPVPGWMTSSPGWPTLTGDGRAMVYRAGAELVGVEIFRRHMGPRYFARFGQATWVGVLRGPDDKPVGPYVTKPDKLYGDMTAEVSSVILEDYLKSGRGPTYMDGRGISNEDHDYMMYWLTHEGSAALLNNMKEEGIDYRKNPVEFGTYHPIMEGKICINEKAQTSMKGLFAAGDESVASMGPSAVYGWLAGENAALHAKSIAASDIESGKETIENDTSLISAIRSRKNGPDWKEANVALQQIMNDYAGVVRSESLLKAGLSYIQRLKTKVNSGLIAENQWELTRCLETRNLIDLGELIMLAANERKESRGLHKRTDYPLTNPMLDGKALFIRKVQGKPLTEWKKMV